MPKEIKTPMVMSLYNFKIRKVTNLYNILIYIAMEMRIIGKILGEILKPVLISMHFMLLHKHMALLFMPKIRHHI